MSEDLREQLVKVVGTDGVKQNEPMKFHTTFRVGGTAQFFVTPHTDAQIAALIKLLRETQTPYLVMGNGSNLLVRDGGIRGVVIALGDDFSGITLRPADEEGTVILTAQAGVKLGVVGNTAARRDLTGFEFACGIPGSVGGAIRMNAGAYGGEMSQIVTSAKLLFPDGTMRELSTEELQFSYRTSFVDQNDCIVLSASYRLRAGDPEQIHEKMADLAARRRDKQPLEFPSAGSTFKRPKGYFAGKLIMDAGLKGFKIGGAAVSEKHAGFVINKGRATAADVEAVIGHVQDKVFEEFGVRLEPEVKIVGEKA